MSFGTKILVLITLMIISVIYIGIFLAYILLIGISYVVYKDAKGRGEKFSLGWAIFVGALLIIGLPCYYFRVVRNKPLMEENRWFTSKLLYSIDCTIGVCYSHYEILSEGITSWVFGMPNLEPDRDRYTDSIWRRNGEKPVESIQVGPGIGLDYTSPASGGFHQYNRIMPNNISDYKSNQLENRINIYGGLIQS